MSSSAGWLVAATTRLSGWVSSRNKRNVLRMRRASPTSFPAVRCAPIASNSSNRYTARVRTVASKITRSFSDVSPMYLLISASSRIVNSGRDKLGGQRRGGHRLPGARRPGEQQPVDRRETVRLEQVALPLLVQHPVKLLLAWPH